jgi:hypothetical protein
MATMNDHQRDVARTEHDTEIEAESTQIDAHAWAEWLSRQCAGCNQYLVDSVMTDQGPEFREHLCGQGEQH